MIAALSRLSPTMPTTSQQKDTNEQLNPLHRSNTEHLLSARPEIRSWARSRPISGFI